MHLYEISCSDSTSSAKELYAYLKDRQSLEVNEIEINEGSNIDYLN